MPFGKPHSAIILSDQILLAKLNIPDPEPRDGVVVISPDNL